MSREQDWRGAFGSTIFKTQNAQTIENLNLEYYHGFDYSVAPKIINEIKIRTRNISYVEDPNNVSDQMKMKYNLKLSFTDGTNLRLNNKRPNASEIYHALSGSTFDVVDPASAYTATFNSVDSNPNNGNFFYSLKFTIFWKNWNPFDMLAIPQVGWEWSYPTDVLYGIPTTQETFNGNTENYTLREI